MVDNSGEETDTGETPESLPEAGEFAILELDRDRSIYPGYYAAVLIRATVAQILNTPEVRGTVSQILKGDYHATDEGRHSVHVRSDSSQQEGTVYRLVPL